MKEGVLTIVTKEGNAKILPKILKHCKNVFVMLGII
jgi:hypothetical protein